MTQRTKDSARFEKVLLAHVDHPDSRSLDHYRSHGGYETARRVLSELKPDEVIEEVKASDLRGRGGAGFPCGMKWGFVPKQIDRPKYLVVNADESEPGTFKDRVILERDPHQLLEGMIIAAYAIDSQVSYVYIRGEFVEGYRVMQKAIEEACAAGVLGDDVLGTGVRLDVTMHRGAGAYICGEETGLLNSLESPTSGKPRFARFER